MTTFLITLAVAIIYFASLGWRARRERAQGEAQTGSRLDGVVTEIQALEQEMYARDAVPIDTHERLLGGVYGEGRWN